MEDKIREAMEQIRPLLQRDGGDIEFVEYTDDSAAAGTLRGLPRWSYDLVRSGREDSKRSLS